MKPLLFLFALLSAALLPAAIVPISLDSTSNRFLTGKDPWLGSDKGEMKVLPAGYSFFGGIPFRINSKILILSKQHKQQVVLGPVDKVNARLYLLHASADFTQKKETVGEVTIKYKDGSVAKTPILFGQDVFNWNTSNSVSNCAVVWSEYNGVTQASLGVTAIRLKRQPIESITLTGSKKPWIICGISAGDKIQVRRLHKSLKIKPGYPAPSIQGVESVLTKQYSGKPKNIILLIGDGMGCGAQKFGSIYAHGMPGKLVMEQLPAAGLSMTYSANATVTDSAAGGTALATGCKTNNGHVAVTPEKKPLRTIAEAARDSGRSVGILTNDSLVGATPADFTAHVPSRSMGDEIALAFRNSKYDVIIGSDCGSFNRRKDHRDLIKEMTAEKVGYIRTLADFRKSNAKSVFGLIPRFEHDENIKLLSEFTMETIKRLESNPKGFFLMIEHTAPDHGSHGNNPTHLIKGVLGTDWIVRSLLDYIKDHPDTLLVVTADHETGDVFTTVNRKNRQSPVIYFGGSSHSAMPVPIWAVGPGADSFNGIMENFMIPRKLAGFWELRIGEVK